MQESKTDGFKPAGLFFDSPQKQDKSGRLLGI